MKTNNIKTKNGIFPYFRMQVISAGSILPAKQLITGNVQKPVILGDIDTGNQLTISLEDF